MCLGLHRVLRRLFGGWRRRDEEPLQSMLPLQRCWTKVRGGWVRQSGLKVKQWRLWAIWSSSRSVWWVSGMFLEAKCRFWTSWNLRLAFLEIERWFTTVFISHIIQVWKCFEVERVCDKLRRSTRVPIKNPRYRGWAWDHGLADYDVILFA